jgi:hypothetical protein
MGGQAVIVEMFNWVWRGEEKESWTEAGTLVKRRSIYWLQLLRGFELTSFKIDA